MSSSVRAFSAGPSTLGRASGSRKRVLSDSEDTSSAEADVDTIRTKITIGAALDGGAEPKRDSRDKDKKRRKRKKRKMSVVVQSAQENASGGEAQGRAANTRPGERGRSASFRSSSITLDSVATTVPVPKHFSAISSPQPSAGPSSNVPERKPRAESSEAVPAVEVSEKSKGKQREASIPRTLNGNVEDGPAQKTIVRVNELTAEITTKTDLVGKHSTLLSTMQHSLTCQICLDLMHKPYALAPCGHTACHSCLVSWFNAPPADTRPQDVLPTWLRKKTCPHCRAIVKERPVEVWAVKDMVAALVKSELAAAAFPPPPPPDADKNTPNTDPWEGIFRKEPTHAGHMFPGPAPPALFHQMMGLHDAEDGGVYRCLDCNHEIADGVCSSCGRAYPGHVIGGDDDDGYYDYDDYDLDDPADLAELMFGGGRYGLMGGLGDVDDEDDDYDDDEGSEHSGGSWRFDRFSRGGGDTDVDIAGEVENDRDPEDGYESSFIDDDEVRIDSDEESVRRGSIGVGLTRFRSRPLRGAPSSSPIILSADSGDEGSDIPHSEVPEVSRLSRRRVIYVSSEDEGSNEDGDSDLAAEVAAHELDLYGDDGSVPRWRALRDD